MKIYEFFLKTLKKNPHKIFITSEKKNYTYEQVNNLINNFEKNKFTGDFVTIINKNSIYHFVLYLLCSKLNKILVTLNHETNLEIISNQIKEFKLDNIFCSEQLKKKLNQKLNKNFLSVYSNHSFLSKKKRSKIKNDIFLLTFSSGSSSKPKPIAISEKTKIERAKSNISSFKILKKDIIIISTPLHHTLAIRLMTIGLILESKIIFMENYNFHNFLKLIKYFKCNFTFFISNQLIEILKNKIKPSLLKSLRCLVSSSASLPLKKKNELMKIFSKNIYEMYGLSEAAVVSVLNINSQKRNLGSVGKPIKNVKLKINYFKNEKVGEIEVKSKYLFLGYYIKNKLKRISKKSFFKTGDIGYIKNGFLYFSGRKKNFVKINGISIYLDDIYNLLIQKKIVEDCVLTYVEDNENINPRICLLFQSKRHNINYLRNFCFKNLSTYQIPTYFLKLNEIPRNKMKKLNMVEIQKIITKKLAFN